MKKILLPLLSLFLVQTIFSQKIKSPGEYLGYELGTKFTYHHKAVEYFTYVAENSKNAEFITYGHSWEGRPLVACIVSSEANLQKLEEYKTNNLIKTGLKEGKFTGIQVPIIWLAYSVHGTESSGMEAALKVLYTIVSGEFHEAKEWLNSCIIVIDPCQNPDGRELYATQFNRSKNIEPNPDPNAWEHYLGWQNPRLNHYHFDLNRDWVWQVQAETRQRIAFYQKFMPHIHADFHEMGSESTFFFAPGAKPMHNEITPWQREFHRLMGIGNSHFFNEKFRLYFTRESYDLFSPAYGDTWPIFNGAIGFTIEQGGGGEVGLALTLSSGDTLTLKKRIEGMYLSSLATLRVSYENREKLVAEFNKYFENNQKNPESMYKSFIIKGNNEKSTLLSLLNLLDNNQIRYNYASVQNKKLRGFAYQTNKEEEFAVDKGDILLSVYQPNSKLLTVLFEPGSKASDSLSYDLTAWALPYVYNLNAYALKDQLIPEKEKVVLKSVQNEIPQEKPYAFVVDFTGFNEQRFISELFRHNIKIRYSLRPFRMNGKAFNRGSLIISRGDNVTINEGFEQIVVHAANATNTSLMPVKTGLVDEGSDLGSDYTVLKSKPHVALLVGEGTSQGTVGSLRFYFEQELKFPVTLVHTAYAQKVDFGKYDMIILANGSFGALKKQLSGYLKKGGKILAIGRAVQLFATDSTTGLYRAVELRKKELRNESQKERSDDPSLLKRFENAERDMLPQVSASSIYKVKLDETHPLAFGLGKEWFILKRNEGFPFLANGYNIGYITGSEPVAGFAGFKFKQKVINTFVIATETLGAGQVIYITDDPYFRAFWKSGRVLIGNCIFR
jgi:hypothetical protein